MCTSSPPKIAECSRPVIIRHAGWRWEVMPGVEEIVRSREDWRFESLQREFAGRLMKDKRTRIVFALDTPVGSVGVKALVFDEFEVRLRSLFGRCRTRKEWENHERALRAGVPTVERFAFGELRQRFLVREAVILTEWKDNAITVNEWRRAQAETGDKGTAERVAAEIGRITAVAQRAGLYHNEIMPDNLLVENPDTDLDVLLIDWKHAYIKARTIENDVQNLLRTGSLFARYMAYAPPTDAEKRAFLSAYLDASADGPDRTKLIGELERLCDDTAWITF